MDQGAVETRAEIVGATDGTSLALEDEDDDDAECSVLLPELPAASTERVAGGDAAGDRRRADAGLVGAVDLGGVEGDAVAPASRTKTPSATPTKQDVRRFSSELRPVSSSRDEPDLPSRDDATAKPLSGQTVRVPLKLVSSRDVAGTASRTKTPSATPTKQDVRRLKRLLPDLADGGRWTVENEGYAWKIRRVWDRDGTTESVRYLRLRWATWRLMMEERYGDERIGRILADKINRRRQELERIAGRGTRSA